MNLFQVVFLCSTKKLFEKFLDEAVSNSEILPLSTTQSDFCAVTQEGKKGKTCHSYGHSYNVYRGKSLLFLRFPKKKSLQNSHSFIILKRHGKKNPKKRDK